MVAKALASNGVEAVIDEIDDDDFPDGESRVDLTPIPGGDRALVLQDLCGAGTDYRALFRALATVRAYTEFGSSCVDLFAPYLIHSRQDRQVKGEWRSPTLHLLAEMLQAAGTSRLVTVAAGDAAAIRAAFWPQRIDFIDPLAYFVGELRNYDANDRPCLVSVDDGAARSIVRRLAHVTECRVVGFEKLRLDPNTVALQAIGPLPRRACRFVITDDLVSSAGTIETAIAHLPMAATVDVVTTHLRPTEVGVDRLTRLHEAGLVASLTATDSILPSGNLSFVRYRSLADVCAGHLGRLYGRSAR